MLIQFLYLCAIHLLNKHAYSLIYFFNSKDIKKLLKNEINPNNFKRNMFERNKYDKSYIGLKKQVEQHELQIVSLDVSTSSEMSYIQGAFTLWNFHGV